MKSGDMHLEFPGELQYGSLSPPLHAFDSLWISALENNVVLRIPLD